MNKAKMSHHSRAAHSAAEVVRRVIDGMDDTPFMQEQVSERTALRQDRAESVRALMGDAPQSVLERVAREMEHDSGL